MWITELPVQSSTAKTRKTRVNQQTHLRTNRQCRGSNWAPEETIPAAHTRRLPAVWKKWVKTYSGPSALLPPPPSVSVPAPCQQPRLLGTRKYFLLLPGRFIFRQFFNKKNVLMFLILFICPDSKYLIGKRLQASFYYKILSVSARPGEQSIY